MEQFHYLLNAFERAAQADSPADAGYAEKRKALIEHLTALNKDAERYRFIRDSTPEQFVQFEPRLYSGGDELDELTDAAMAGANNK